MTKQTGSDGMNEDICLHGLPVGASCIGCMGMKLLNGFSSVVPPSGELKPCQAGIDGGCGACEVCDPIFWIKKLKEQLASERERNKELEKDVESLEKTNRQLEMNIENLEEDAAEKDARISWLIEFAYELFEYKQITRAQLDPFANIPEPEAIRERFEGYIRESTPEKR